MTLFDNNLIFKIKFFWHCSFWIFYVKTFINKKRRRYSPLAPQKNQFVDYYCKINSSISDLPLTTINDVNLTSDSGYSYDIYKILINFPNHLRFNFSWGDLTNTPLSPTFVKCRPIRGDNSNAILLPLNTFRHLRFIDDQIPYQKKKSMAVWRGAAYQSHRKDFLNATKNLSFCNVADTSRDSLTLNPNNYLSLKRQLEYKIIFSIEGNDVATNLKWIMSSNSLCFSLPLVYETWFREGTLIPGKHFVEIKSDFSDLEEKFNYYISHPEDAQEIIRNAQKHVAQFRDLKSQYYLAEMVAEKYFKLTKQL